MPRRYGRRTTPRRRIAKMRREILAYSVPRQGVRHRRTPAQARAEWEGAQAALRYRAAARAERARAPVHARPINAKRKKRPWWSWLILDYQGFQQDRRNRRR